MADADDVRWLQRLENYERALATLERALTLATSRPLSELEQQGLIQAFEFTHELSWLLLKDFLVDQTFQQRMQGVGSAVEGGLGQSLIRRKSFSKGLTGVQTAEALHTTRRKPEPSLKPNTPNC